jgi:hypothetical protein
VSKSTFRLLRSCLPAGVIKRMLSKVRNLLNPYLRSWFLDR